MPARIVLLNPSAAGGRAARLAGPLRDWLAQHAPDVALIESDGITRALATLRCLPARSRVVLVGGDGTLHHMLPAFLTHRHVLGVVPLGSGNDAARAFGLHRLGWPAALGLALGGTPRRIDTGEVHVGGRWVPFVSSLAAGFDAAVAQRALGVPAWLAGRPRYVAATLLELAVQRRWSVRLRIDGEAHPAPARALLFASTLNTPSYGAGMPAAPDAAIDDGRLELLCAGRFGRADVLRMLPLLMRGRHLGHPQVALRRFESLQILSDPALPLAADGEPLAAATRFEVRVRAASLSVVTARGQPGVIPS